MNTNNEVRENIADNFTMELFHEFKGQQKGRTIISATAIIGLVIVILVGIHAHQQSEKEWKDLFSSYDYVSQDGNGQNYYNADIVGDINNGTED